MIPSSALRKPVMMSNKVVLPAPLGPIKAVIEFFSTVKDTASSARKPLKFFVRS